MANENPNLHRGCRGEVVMKWQRILINAGKDLGPMQVDGDFGVRTEQATSEYQHQLGLPTTGVVDAATWAAADDRASGKLPVSRPTFIQAKSYSAGNRQLGDIDLIILHDMEYPERITAAEDVAKWFAGPNAPKASAHFNVDVDSVVQCVREQDVAWHTPGRRPDGRWVNNVSIGIEHAGYAKQTAEEWADAYSSGMLARSAKLTAELCHRWNVPAVKLTSADLKAGARGICGHVDCSEAYGGSHWDPGPNFPWDTYMQLVGEELARLKAEDE